MSASCSYTSRIPVNVKYHLHFTRENIVYCSSQLLSRFHQLDSNPDTFLVFFFTEKTRVKFLHKPSVWHTFADVRFRRESVSSADDSSRLIIESSQCIITWSGAALFTRMFFRIWDSNLIAIALQCSSLQLYSLHHGTPRQAILPQEWENHGGTVDCAENSCGPDISFDIRYRADFKAWLLKETRSCIFEAAILPRRSVLTLVNAAAPWPYSQPIIFSANVTDPLSLVD